MLGLAGLLPFIWGAITVLHPELALSAGQTIGGRFVGPYVQLAYGQVILAFMSGVLWGFATKQSTALPYALSVVPALWAFFMVGNGPEVAAINLIFGFVGLLALDWHFARQNLTPPWWMTLRVGLTAVVTLCLAITAI